MTASHSDSVSVGSEVTWAEVKLALGKAVLGDSEGPRGPRRPLPRTRGKAQRRCLGKGRRKTNHYREIDTCETLNTNVQLN